MTDQPKCETCRYWQLVEVPEMTGDCRRNPPSMQGHIAPHGDIQFQSPQLAIWPTVRDRDWCGEHVAKDAGDHIGETK